MALDWKKTSKWWYARYRKDGKTRLINLGIEIKGVRPDSINGEGDGAFERSRGRAIQEHDRVMADLERKGNLVELSQRVIEIKTGNRVESTPLAKLPEAWESIERKRPPSPRYIEQCKGVLERFVAHMAKKWPAVEGLDEVTREHTRSFMQAEEKRKISPKTWNYTLSLLRTTFRHLQPEADGFRNHLMKTPTKELATINRMPFTPAELGEIVTAAERHTFIHPIIVTGICTAMRAGDCCTLRWDAVDLEGRYITVKTSKTGQTVSIPIFPMLEDVLKQRQPGESPYVFPEQAEMYRTNPSGITWRFRKVLKDLGFKDDEVDKETGEIKRARGAIHAERDKGQRRGSVRDFHSFRVTWVTLALTAGVPLELVQKVTGHKTTDIVLKHYFQPGKEAFREALENAMPALLMGALEETKEESGSPVNSAYKSPPTPSEHLDIALKEISKIRSGNEHLTKARDHIAQAKEWYDRHIISGDSQAGGDPDDAE